jgi:hypothetical protein
MECSVYVQLLTEYHVATAEYSAATSNLFTVSGNGDKLSFSEGHEMAELAHARCQRTLAAVKLHRAEHRCASGELVTTLR